MEASVTNKASLFRVWDCGLVSL